MAAGGDQRHQGVADPGAGEKVGIEVGFNMVDRDQRQAGGVGPVSYTHLDVYKRQILISPFNILII